MLQGLGHLESQVSDQFALFVSNVVDYAIIMLDPDGNIVTWNEGAQRIKGYAASDIIGRHFSIFYPAEAVRSGKPDWVLEVAARDGRYEEEGWRLRNDRTRFWASVVVTAVRDEDGRLRGFGKVTRDLTERHLQEVEREAARRHEAAQLRAHADRMAQFERTKAEFLNLASHELRGPLAVVRGYNSMLRDGTIGPHDIPRISLIVEGKLAQMDMLIEQMLETARLEYGEVALNLETVDLSALVIEQVDKYRHLSRGHEFRIEGTQQEVTVKADRARITMIIANLLDNALKYSPAGGEISCTVGKVGSEAFVEVCDQGIGIQRQHLARLFTRFGRLPTEQNLSIPGTGLGLFLCREIATRHKGDITVDSETGVGSKFRLTLPALKS